MSCGLEDIQAYFNVENGGLRLHGLGAVVSMERIKAGEAYELEGKHVGLKVLKEICKRKGLSGMTVIERVKWEPLQMDRPEPAEEVGDRAEVIPGTSSSSSSTNRKVRPRVHSKTASQMNTESQEDLSVTPQLKPINWTIVTVCVCTIIFFLFVLFGYMQRYDPNNELIIREGADQMTAASFSIVVISFFFGVLSFFH